jgi:anion-transporting  ArsA/GET3 family ATPase
MAALTDKRLLVVSGKGGVGKSTVAAALAVASARAGLRTLVCEVNSKERLTVFLGKPEVGPKIGLLDENLWAVDIQPHEAMREYALMVLKFESVYNAVFENRLVRYFLRFIPSLQELVMLGKILFHLQEKLPDGSWRFDRVIVDAPATGHAISFLSVPQVLMDTVPPGPMSNEAKKMRDLLVDPAVTAVVLVSLPEELPVNETIELKATLTERVHLTTRAVVLNGFDAPRFSPSDLTALEASPALALVGKGHADRARLSAVSRERLESALGLSPSCVPRLYHSSFGPKAIDEVAACLQPLIKDGV